MKKILIMSLLCFPLLLANCSEKVTEQTTYTLGNAFSVAEQAADQYTKGSFGTPKADVLEEIEKYDNAAYKAIEKVTTAAAAGNSVTTTDEVAATTAIEALITYLESQGVTVNTDSMPIKKMRKLEGSIK